MLFEEPNYYELFEVEPNASPKQLHEAYIKAKSLFEQENLATYSMYSDEERKNILNKIEEAYQTLSNPTKKSLYDDQHNIKTPRPLAQNHPSQKNHRIPATLIETTKQARTQTHEYSQIEYIPTPPPSFKNSSKHDRDLAERITNETKWTGEFLKEIRLCMGISTEELAQKTKLKKTYIDAIEAEDFANLPAAVYVRGFVSQIAKALSLPSEKVTLAYFDRYKQKLGKS
jgi:flagellar biosynthesis protein FlhG